MGRPFEELDGRIEALLKERPEAKLRTYEDVERYFTLAAATCEFSTETESRFWDRAARLAPPGTEPWEAGRAWYIASHACIMASGLGSAKFVIPGAEALVGDPARTLAEFMDALARALEDRAAAARTAFIERVAAACERDPMFLIDGDDVTSAFRNLKRIVEEPDPPDAG